MSRIRRRQFLQFAGSTLATLGLSQLDIQRGGLRYGKVLAQGTPRKLALLVGINEYPKTQRFTPLMGCTNDVELQRQLLVHRFGFQDSNIKILTNSQATRQGILTAFDEHLIKQAKPGDVVVFHFSGHGSRVADPDPIGSDRLNSTFVPADDSPLSQEGVVNDIMGHTLFLLMSALKEKTENVTVVLDSCHSGGGTRGNIRIRAVSGGGDFKTSPTELEYQQQWLNQLKLSRQDFLDGRKKGIATGVVIAATRRDQFAADYEFPGFSAGAFTYLLTQYLWQQTDAVERVIDLVKSNIRLLSPQVPLLEAKPNTTNEKKPVYFIPKENLPAEAAITDINGDRAKLWLGGIPRDSMDAFDKGATFITVSSTRKRGATQVELVSRNGLVGEAIVKGTAQRGELLQEFARAIPNDWQLLIGLDPSLAANAADAQQALQKLNRIQAVPSQPGNPPYPKEVHYILSRMTAAYRQKLPKGDNGELPPEGSIGLFSPALELIPKSFGNSGETVDQAISRLRTKLKSLLAARIVKMTLNAQSSRLDLVVTMTLEKGQEVIGQAFTPRGCRQNDEECRNLGSRGGSGERPTQQLPVGAPFQFRVTNREKSPLYLGILLIDPAEGIVVFFPNEFQSASAEQTDQATRIKPNQTLLIPDPSKDEFELVTEEPGVGEVLVIASQKPLTNALLRLRDLAKNRGQKRGVLETTGDDSVDVVSDLIDDLSGMSGTRRGVANVRQRVATADIAALSITFEVLKKS